MDLYRSDFKRFEEFKTETTYFNPELTYTTRDPDVQGSVNGLEGLAYYLSAVKSPKLDRFVSLQIIQTFFLRCFSLSCNNFISKILSVIIDAFNFAICVPTYEL